MLALALLIAACPPPPAERVTCVVDGDTIWLAGEKMRLADIDTPELAGQCPRERELALQAQARLIGLLNARPARLEPSRIRRQGKDRFGRTLVRIEGVGAALIAEGLATRWPKRGDWCRL